MATLKEQVEAVVSDLILNEDRVDLWVNGGNSTEYTTSGGVKVPSIRKFLQEVFAWRGVYTPGAEYTVGQVFKGPSVPEFYIAYKVTTGFTATDFASDAANFEIFFDLSEAAVDAIVAKDLAVAAATAAGASEEAINIIWLGGFADDPLVDNNGDPLVAGAAYLNTTDDEYRVFDGTLWSAPATASAASAAAAAQSAAAAAAVPAPQLNPKAFAGGVAAFGTGDQLTKMDGIPAFTQDSDFSFNLRAKVHGFVGTEATIFRIGASNPNVRMYANSSRFSIGLHDGSAPFVSFVGSISTGVWYNLAFVVKAKTDIKLYKDGVLAITLPIATVADFTLDTLCRLFSSSLISGQFDGSISDFTMFNTALDATQAQEIYQQGVSAWLAANPEYKWGEPNQTGEGSFAVDTGVFEPSMSGSIYAFGVTQSGEDNCISLTHDGSGLNGLNLVGDIPVGTIVSYDLYVYAPSSNPYENKCSIKSGASSIGGPSSLPIPSDTWTRIKGEFKTTADTAALTLSFEGIANVFYVKSLYYQIVGCLAHLPMDEGIGYQLHDQSPNHFDALLSTTGCEHLNPKREGFVRDFNVDAFTSPVDLITSAQDILDTDAIETTHVSDATGTLTFVRNANNITVQSDNAADTAIKLRLNTEKID